MGVGPTGAPVTYEASATFPCDPQTPARARGWALTRIREGLAGTANMLLDDAALVVSELTTNAMRGGSPATIRLQVAGSRLRVAVSDVAPGRPRLRRPGAGETSGRGLQVVAALADEWGVDEVGRGKEVWAELSLVPARAM